MPQSNRRIFRQSRESDRILQLVDKIHQAALKTGVFEVGAVRTRAAKRTIT